MALASIGFQGTCCGTCRVCLDVYGCGTRQTATITVYPSSDGSCTGTPVYTGSYDATGALCFTLAATGTYDIKVTPTGAAALAYQEKCASLTIADCAVTTTTSYTLLPINYSVGVGVFGCDTLDATGEPNAFSCPLEGVTVQFDDGINSPIGTTDASGYVSFGPMPARPAGTGYVITLSNLPADCGWDDPSTITGTTGDPCSGQTFQVHPTVDTGYTCVGVCDHPFKNDYTLSIYGGTVTLALQGVILSGGTTTAAYYYGCGSMTCGSAIKPKYCDTNPAGYRHRYEVASDTIPFIARLWLYPVIDIASDPFTGQPCGPKFTARLEIEFVSSGGYIGCELETPDTFPTPLACGPIGSLWCVNYPGGVPTWTTALVECDGDSLVVNTSCEGNVEAGSVGNIGGGTGCASYVFDQQELDCLPCPFTMSGSVGAEAGNTIACMEDSYTIS